MNASFEEIMDYSPENQKVFNELLSLCRNNMIVPYIGAGMSAFAGFSIPNLKNRKLFPTWTGLINTKYSEYFKDKESPKDLINAADEIERVMGKEDFYEYIRVTMGGNLNEEWSEILKEAENQAISVIPKLFFCPMVTTNFDQILERIYSESIPIPVFFPYHTENLKQAIDERKQLLYKIHGCVSDAQNIVLAKSKYNEVYNPKSDLVKSLSQFCQGFHFLFLGCSLTLNDNDGTTDYSTKLLLDLQEKSKMPHYAILPCEKDKMSDRRIELEKRNIYPIFYENASKKHEEVKIILDNLKDEIENQLFQIPKYNRLYTERKDSIIAKIENKLEKSKYSILAIRGDAGVGKTRVMREYALQNKKGYNSNNIFWFSAISADSVREEVRNFVVKYQGVSENEKDTNKIFDAFEEWIRKNDSYLFLLDNVENHEDIKVFLDDKLSTYTGTRHILITSRLNEKELNNIPTENIEVFEKEDARNFLQSHTDKEKYDEEYADKIAILLDNLPLALEQAVAIIQDKKEETYEKFYVELVEEPFSQLEKQHPEPGAVPVAATWNMAMQRISSDAAKELLWLCSYFAPDNINDQWFVDASEVLPENLKVDVLYKLNEIEEQLTKYSLVSIDSGKISIHRLLQDVIRKALKEEQEKWVEFGTAILEKQIFNDFSIAQSRIIFVEIVPHCDFLIEQYEQYRKGTEKLIKLYSFLEQGFYELADYDQSLEWNYKALEWYKKAMRFKNKIYGNQHPNIANTHNNIALIFTKKGEYNEALRWYKKALKIQQKTLGKTHPYTAITLNNIGGIYSRKGEYGKALRRYNKALKIQKEQSNEKNDIAITSNNIAVTYELQGNYDKALDLHKETLKINEKTLGEKHPNTAVSYNNLGVVYSLKKDFDNAMKLHKKALKIHLIVLGENHPDTANSFNSVAGIYARTGRYGKSLYWYQKALAVYEANIDNNLPIIATTYNNIALVYADQKRYDEALELHFKALNIQEKIFGKNHPDTRAIYSNIASIYEEKREPDVALEWYQKVLDALEEILVKE